MNEKNQNKAEEERENLRQEELKKNPLGNLNDGLKRGQTGNLVDLVGNIGWKTTLFIIIIIIITFIVMSIFS